MIILLLPYLIVFALSSLLLRLFQRVYNSVYIQDDLSENRRRVGKIIYCLFGCIAMFPVIAMYGLRYGIGTDYFGYEEIFDTLHTAPFIRYLRGFLNSEDAYYVEPAYYFLNKLLPSYRVLLWILGLFLLLLVCIALKSYSRKINFALALFIYLSTQFIYAMNGVRFAVALCLVMLAYHELIKDRTFRFVVIILIATMFHRSVLLCMAMYFLKQYRFREVNSLRNIVLFVLIMSFPLAGGAFLKIAEKIPYFSRYFSKSIYSASESMSSGWMWMFHVVPPLLPLILLAWREISEEKDTKILFRICMMEIPFRMLGLYNTWYTRFTRCSQIAQVLFIPLVLDRVKKKGTRVTLYLYYIVWFSIYFAYYAIVNDRGDSLPYTWIFSH